jgi:glycosyltransferase involved in cell wall biosynthesis
MTGTVYDDMTHVLPLEDESLLLPSDDAVGIQQFLRHRGVEDAASRAKVLKGEALSVLFLNYEFPPHCGGAGTATWFMARELARCGHTVHILTCGEETFGSRDIIDGVVIHRVHSWRRGTHESGLAGAASYLYYARRRLEEILNTHSFDCAHFFFGLPTGVLAPAWQRLTSGKPYIISLRGSDVPGYDSSPVLKQLHRLLRPLSSRILHGAASVIANSVSLQRLALVSYPDIELGVITNAVSGTAFCPPGDDNARHEGRRLLCVSRLVKRKGLDTLIKALARCRTSDLQLVIAGEGPCEGNLLKLTRKLNLTDRVVFTGRVEGSALQKLYRSADCFVLPSISESFSMALLEAMSSGLPVVGSDVGGIPELVKDGVNGILVPPSQVNALAEAVDRMFIDQVRLKLIGAANREKILRGYTWQAVVQQYWTHCYEPALRKAGSLSG